MANRKGRKGESAKALVPPVTWTSWHVCLLDENKQWRKHPVADDLLGGCGDEPDTAVQKMKLFETLGWPAARGSLIIGKADDDQPPVGILKCKPSCWRLYFHVFKQKANDKRILYLRALCKKGDDQQPEDTARARNLLTAALDGRIRISRWPFRSD